MTEFLLESRGSHVRVLRINGEARLNTLRRTMLDELETHVRALEADADVRVVIITGSGPIAFCAGADLRERQAMDVAQVRVWLADLKRVFLAIERSRRVYVAAINGAAMGGGCELALACDLRVADPAAQLGLPEVKLGILPGAGGTVRLARVVGLGRARDLILTGRRVSAAEALAMGLVNRLAPPRESLAEALALAEEIAANAPVAVAEAKASLREGWDCDLETALDREHVAYEPLLATADRLEGLAAFAEKRKPKYIGR